MKSQSYSITQTPASGKIAFIQACWHKDIVDRSRESFLSELEVLGLSNREVSLFEVAGAYEIPLQCKKLSQTGAYDVIVAAALVVDGGIYRHEFVAQAVISGMMQVQLDTEVPIVSVVLTPKDFHETETHQQFFQEHFKLKGREAAQAAASLLKNAALLDSIDVRAERTTAVRAG